MLLTDESPTAIKAQVKDILTVTVNSNKYSCKELELVGVTDSEMGKAIRENVELRERLSDALGINRMKLWPELKIANREIYEESRYATPTLAETPSE